MRILVIPVETIKRFWKSVAVTDVDKCWMWTGAVNADGYGQVPYTVSREITPSRLAHRVAYVLFRGRQPKKRMVIHKCDNPTCCNPTHLRVGTNTTNMRDASRKGRIRNQFSNTTHCSKGHEFTPSNTYHWRNERRCRTCIREAARRRRHPCGF